MTPETSAEAAAAVDTRGLRTLCGWSPPDREADTSIKRIVDRLVPRTGAGVCLYFAAVAGQLLVAPLLTKRFELGVDGLPRWPVTWCGINLWRCQHAHCVATTSGWLVLALLSFAEATMGRSLIAGDEQLVFLAVLVAGLLLECAWTAARGTNALTSR